MKQGLQEAHAAERAGLESTHVVHVGRIETSLATAQDALQKSTVQGEALRVELEERTRQLRETEKESRCAIRKLEVELQHAHVTAAEDLSRQEAAAREAVEKLEGAHDLALAEVRTSAQSAADAAAAQYTALQDDHSALQTRFKNRYMSKRACFIRLYAYYLHFR